MLASRLHDDLSVFALILFSIQLFALFPVLRHRLQASPVIIQTALTLALACFSVVLTAPLSVAVTYIFLTASVAVNFAAPAVLIWAQRYKNEISGPWDAATPKISL
ncbi:hypothetical protein EWM64_g5082 [Hericium alpestre]|uniref:Uncharacterized protein n=1 Tax=Hericium alpestre TaxID=135208 RepID=A0A4Y9ZXM0_9AGAM|nr:hypothetical protein EWM64_g5082 [Hericium alpestre]